MGLGGSSEGRAKRARVDRQSQSESSVVRVSILYQYEIQTAVRCGATGRVCSVRAPFGHQGNRMLPIARAERVPHLLKIEAPSACPLRPGCLPRRESYALMLSLDMPIDPRALNQTLNDKEIDAPLHDGLPPQLLAPRALRCTPNPPAREKPLGKTSSPTLLHASSRSEKKELRGRSRVFEPSRRKLEFHPIRRIALLIETVTFLFTVNGNWTNVFIDSLDYLSRNRREGWPSAVVKCGFDVRCWKVDGLLAVSDQI